jgi:gliding motility-associated-like protein
VNPKPSLILTPPLTDICIGNETSLNVSGALKYYWSEAGTPYVLGPSSRKFKPEKDQQYQVYGIDAKGCKSDTANASVIVHPLPVVDLGADQVVNRHTRISLSPKVSNDIKYFRWNQDTSLSCLDCPDPAVTIRKPSRFELKVTTEWGCESTDEIIFNINCSGTFLYVPNAFTPNGDGQNDLFTPFRSRFIETINFNVFNRWGQLVFTTTDPQINWDGGNQAGKDVSDGVYYYTCEAFESENQTPIVVSGYIELIRG